jgi:hypothetical protein
VRDDRREPDGSGGATARPWGGSQPRPSGWEAYGRGTAAGPGRPASAHWQSPPLRTSDDPRRASSRPGRPPRRAVSHRESSPSRARPAVACSARRVAPPLTASFPGKTSAPIRRTGRSREPISCRRVDPRERGSSQEGRNWSHGPDVRLWSPPGTCAIAVLSDNPAPHPFPRGPSSLTKHLSINPGEIPFRRSEPVSRQHRM